MLDYITGKAQRRAGLGHGGKAKVEYGAGPERIRLSPGPPRDLPPPSPRVLLSGAGDGGDWDLASSDSPRRVGLFVWLLHALVREGIMTQGLEGLLEPRVLAYIARACRSAWFLSAELSELGSPQSRWTALESALKLCQEVTQRHSHIRRDITKALTIGDKRDLKVFPHLLRACDLLVGRSGRISHAFAVLHLRSAFNTLPPSPLALVTASAPSAHPDLHLFHSGEIVSTFLSHVTWVPEVSPGVGLVGALNAAASAFPVNFRFLDPYVAMVADYDAHGLLPVVLLWAVLRPRTCLPAFPLAAAFIKRAAQRTQPTHPYPLQRALYKWLLEYDPHTHFAWERVTALFTLLIRLDLFSHDKFVWRLVSDGILRSDPKPLVYLQLFPIPADAPPNRRTQRDQLLAQGRKRFKPQHTHAWPLSLLSGEASAALQPVFDSVWTFVDSGQPSEVLDSEAHCPEFLPHRLPIASALLTTVQRQSLEWGSGERVWRAVTALMALDESMGAACLVLSRAARACTHSQLLLLKLAPIVRMWAPLFCYCPPVHLRAHLRTCLCSEAWTVTSTTLPPAITAHLPAIRAPYNNTLIPQLREDPSTILCIRLPFNPQRLLKEAMLGLAGAHTEDTDVATHPLYLQLDLIIQHLRLQMSRAGDVVDVDIAQMVCAQGLALWRDGAFTAAPETMTQLTHSTTIPFGTALSEFFTPALTHTANALRKYTQGADIPGRFTDIAAAVQELWRPVQTWQQQCSLNLLLLSCRKDNLATFFQTTIAITLNPAPPTLHAHLTTALNTAFANEAVAWRLIAHPFPQWWHAVVESCGEVCDRNTEALAAIARDIAQTCAASVGGSLVGHCDQALLALGVATAPAEASPLQSPSSLLLGVLAPELSVRLCVQHPSLPFNILENLLDYAINNADATDAIVSLLLAFPGVCDRAAISLMERVDPALCVPHPVAWLLLFTLRHSQTLEALTCAISLVEDMLCQVSPEQLASAEVAIGVASLCVGRMVAFPEGDPVPTTLRLIRAIATFTANYHNSISPHLQSSILNILEYLIDILPADAVATSDLGTTPLPAHLLVRDTLVRAFGTETVKPDAGEGVGDMVIEEVVSLCSECGQVHTSGCSLGLYLASSV